MDDQASPSSGAVRPLDAEGRPIELPEAPTGSPRSGIATAVLIGVVVAAALGAVVFWRALAGTPFAAAETMPADADLVVTIDFHQLRNLERVDRFIAVFAEPLAEQGVIDEVTDFEGLMRELDTAVEEESGVRLAEDLLSWIGRSGSIGMWFPEDLFRFDPFAMTEVDELAAMPTVLASLEVRNMEAAQAYLDRIIGELEAAGEVIATIDVAGVPGYAIGDEMPAVVALADDRFVIGTSAEVVERGLGVQPETSIAQTDAYEQLSDVIAGDPREQLPEAFLMTIYASPALSEQLADAVTSMGMVDPFGMGLEPAAAMGAVALDDDGLVFRSAAPVMEGMETEPGEWAAELPADTYGFVDVVLPAGFLSEVAEGYAESTEAMGFTRRDLDDLMAPADEFLGMSLLDDLLPQFGEEMLFAVSPAGRSMLAEEAGIDLGLLFGIGVVDAATVDQALDNVTTMLAKEGMTLVEEDGIQTLEIGGTPAVAFAVTEEGLFVASDPARLDAYLADAGELALSEAFVRADDLTVGDGLVVFADVGAIVNDFVDDVEVSDVLAPLVAAGVGARVDGDYEIVEFRIVVDY